MFFRIDRTELRDPAAREAVLTALDTFNDAASGSPEAAGWLNLLLREPGSDSIIGGLCAVSYYRWMFVELLFVPGSLRGQGLGSDLLRQAEAVAQDRFCLGIWLDTFSFQAPGFDQKLGYRQFGRIETYPPNHSRSFFQKRFDPPG